MAEHDPDELVRDLPSGAEDARVLPGFVGTSAKDGYVRLHRLADTSEFLDIPADDVVYRSPVSGAAGTAVVDHSILWVKRSAVIQHNSSVTFDAAEPAALLQGDITEEALRLSSSSGTVSCSIMQRMSTSAFRSRNQRRRGSRWATA